MTDDSGNATDMSIEGSPMPDLESDLDAVDVSKLIDKRFLFCCAEFLDDFQKNCSALENGCRFLKKALLDFKYAPSIFRAKAIDSTINVMHEYAVRNNYDVQPPEGCIHYYAYSEN